MQKLNKLRFIICFFVLFFTNSTLAHTSFDDNINNRVQSLLQNIFSDNAKYVTNHKDATLIDIQDGQTPRATVVSCSD